MYTALQLSGGAVIFMETYIGNDGNQKLKAFWYTKYVLETPDIFLYNDRKITK